jgi:hypothetical protein
LARINREAIMEKEAKKKLAEDIVNMLALASDDMTIEESRMVLRWADNIIHGVLHKPLKARGQEPLLKAINETVQSQT